MGDESDRLADAHAEAIEKLTEELMGWDIYEVAGPNMHPVPYDSLKDILAAIGEGLDGYEDFNGHSGTVDEAAAVLVKQRFYSADPVVLKGHKELDDYVKRYALLERLRLRERLAVAHAGDDQ